MCPRRTTTEPEAGSRQFKTRQAGSEHAGPGHAGPGQFTTRQAGSRRTVGRAEGAARRFFLIAALILVAISLSALLAPLLLSIPPRVTGAISWRPTALGAIVLAGLLLWELRGAWVILLAGACLFELPPLFTQQPTLAVLATLSQTLLVGLVLGFVGTIVLRLSRSADAAGASRERATAAAAAAAGASAARARAAALVHDEVLSTLGLAALPHLVARGRLAEQATRARRLLAEASSDEPRLIGNKRWIAPGVSSPSAPALA